MHHCNKEKITPMKPSSCASLDAEHLVFIARSSFQRRAFLGLAELRAGVMTAPQMGARIAQSERTAEKIPGRCHRDFMMTWFIDWGLPTLHRIPSGIARPSCSCTESTIWWRWRCCCRLDYSSGISNHCKPNNVDLILNLIIRLIDQLLGASQWFTQLIGDRFNVLALIMLSILDGNVIVRWSVCLLLFEMVFPVSAAGPVKTTESGCHHRSHDRSLDGFIGAIVAGRGVTVVGESQPENRMTGWMKRTESCASLPARKTNTWPTSWAMMNAEVKPSSRFSEHDRSGSQTPATGA